MTSLPRPAFVSRTVRRVAGWLLPSLALPLTLVAAEIHDAVLAHDLDRVRQLVLVNPDLVNARTDKGDTPLYIASLKGYKQMVPLLLQMGADPNPAPNSRQETPLSIAREFNLSKTATTLLAAGAIEDDRSRGAQLRYLAMKRDSVALNERLAQAPHLVNAPDAYGQTPLTLAVGADKADLNSVVVLLNWKADPNATNLFGGTPYSVAVEREHTALVTLLKQHGAKETPIARSAPLRSAARKNLLPEVEALLKQHPDWVNAPDDMLRVPLHYASFAGGTKIVAFLLQHGADVNFRDFADNTALHIAAQAGHDEIVALLLAAKAGPNVRNRQQMTPLLHATGQGSTNAVAQLLRAGADLKAANNLGQTVLHAAAGAGSLELVRLFLERGLDVNCRDYQRTTPLHFAAARGNNDVVKLLLERKADPALKDVNGETPLTHSEKRKQEETAKLLRAVPAR